MALPALSVIPGAEIAAEGDKEPNDGKSDDDGGP